MLLSYTHRDMQIGFPGSTGEFADMHEAAQNQSETPSAQREIIRKSQRAYVELLLKQTGLSPRALAKGAGFSSSTLTRFLNEPGHTGLLGTSVLAKLHAKYLVRWAAPEFSAIDSLADLNLPPTIVDAAIGLGKGIVLHRQADRAMEGVGLKLNDVVVVQTGKPPVSGDLVLMTTSDIRVWRGSTTVRLYMKPHLVAVPLAPSSNEELRPVMVDDDVVKILGVVVGTIRWTG